MTDTPLTYERIIDSFLDWATAEPGLRAATIANRQRRVSLFKVSL